ncbi:MAG: hypothetical protein HFI75_12445 [Lachnospiraceae bacterium]|nr:hypothetical protein [Lachnospiraceae bacterium]
MNRLKKLNLFIILILCLFFTACGSQTSRKNTDASYTLNDIPAFSQDPYIILNDNKPDFTDEEKNTEVFENYSELDHLGRCGVAYANICRELMPTEERGAIGMLKPSGWHTVKYDIVDGNYLYNRCHLIGFQLAGENANEKNLITGTRYMNVEGMLPFENKVADYVKENDNHVLYRVTPVYEGNNLLASGVEMEAWSIEDNGKGVCFHVYVYNNQPGITIDYATGESRLSKNSENEKDRKEPTGEENQTENYILNTNTYKFHSPSCGSINEIKEKNKKTYKGSREELIEQGYEPCSRCKP